MRTVFADTQYWIALTNPRDQWRQRALEVSHSFGEVALLTTEEVLTEVLNGLGGIGDYVRRGACDLLRHIRSDPDIEVLRQSHESFEDGVALYRGRPDKGYSLTDCISMQAMRKHGLTEVLSHDHHFEQEGFTILL